MAGAGYKLFNTGDVLLASEVNTYLMQQTVMVFADSAARTTALSGVLAEGMISYLKDTNATEVYNGSAWVGITGDGDITGVTAGTGISGGGTTGTVTITNDMATTITASGDIVVGTGSGTYDNLPIGTTGQVLTADTTVSPYKVKWAAAAGGGANWSLVNSGGTSLSGAQTVTVSGITNADKIFVVIRNASSASAGAGIAVRINNDSGNNYMVAGAQVVNGAAGGYEGSATDRIETGDMSNNASSQVHAVVMITGCNASGVKPFQQSGGGTAAGGAGQVLRTGGGIWDNSATVSSIAVYSSSGNLDNGTVYVYTSG